MGIFTATMEQMAVLFLLITIGFLVAKLKIVPDNTAMILSKLENTLFVPALVLGTFVSNFTVQKLESAMSLFLISFAIGFVMILLANIVAKRCSKDNYVRKIYTYGLSFSNFGFMGNAVVSAVFPNIFVDYLIFTMPLWIMIYLWGVPCLLIPNDSKEQSIKSRLKAFVNPMFISLLIGMIIGIVGLALPNPIMTVVTTVGNCMSPLAMLLTGMTVANMNLKRVFAMRSVYMVSLVRLLIFPLIFIGIFKFVPVSQTIKICAICSLAMPLGLSTIVVPSGYGRDTSVATGMTIVSHVLSAVTIPIIFWLLLK